MNSIEIFLTELSKSLRDSANYFDEAHEYERMNDLDKARIILDALIPIVNKILDKKPNDEREANLYNLGLRNADNFIASIEKARDMRPFEIAPEKEV